MYLPAPILASVVDSFPPLRLAPPIIAITLAIVLKDVNFALVIAVFSGALLLSDLGFSQGVDKLCDVVVGQLSDADHASVILFTVLLGAMIGLMNDSGGTQAVVNRLARYASNRRRGQVLTWLSGLVVFFDDYANTMLIGGSMRPLCDRLRISRAKLAFLIDATAAPVAGLLLSTWTAYEIGEVGKGLIEANIDSKPTHVFLESLPYRLYPILALIAVGAVAVSGRDFGSMWRAESRAGMDSSPATDEADEGNIWLAIVPVTTLVLVVALGVWREGLELNAYLWLLYASVSASSVAAIVALRLGAMSIRECSESWARGITSMVPAIIVLVLAWSVSAVCSAKNLDTAGYIISLIGESVSAEFMPAIAFIVAGAIAAAIGSSFTTMALLFPVFLPLCWGVMSEQQIAELGSSHPIFLGVVGAILAGAIFGDHCSPISDTTVLSSAAAGCDHLEHVTTQLPYALLVAACSLVFGYLPIGFGVPWWIVLPLSACICVGAIVFLGKSPDSSMVEVSADHDEPQTTSTESGGR